MKSPSTTSLFGTQTNTPINNKIYRQLTLKNFKLDKILGVGHYGNVINVTYNGPEGSKLKNEYEEHQNRAK